MIVQILCALLIIAGLFILLNINPFDVFGNFFKPLQKRKEKTQRLRRITGKSKGKIAQTIDDAKEMLITSGMAGKTSAYKWSALILAVIGLQIGLAMDNILAALVLAAGLGCSLLIIIRIRTGDYLRSLHDKLENAMNTVTNSHIASCDLIGAVESSLHLLPSPVDAIFR